MFVGFVPLTIEEHEFCWGDREGATRRVVDEDAPEIEFKGERRKKTKLERVPGEWVLAHIDDTKGGDRFLWVRRKSGAPLIIGSHDVVVLQTCLDLYIQKFDSAEVETALLKENMAFLVKQYAAKNEEYESLLTKLAECKSEIANLDHVPENRAEIAERLLLEAQNNARLWRSALVAGMVPPPEKDCLYDMAGLIRELHSRNAKLRELLTLEEEKS